MYKINTAEIITLVRGPDIVETLVARKDIQGIRRFKGMVVFRIRSENSKKTLKSNDFWVKDVSNTAVLRRERAGVVVHGIKVKNMPKDIKKEKAKTMAKSYNAIYQNLKIEEIT